MSEVVIQSQSLSSVIEEALPLIQRHWEEIALNKDIIPLSPNHARYADMEAKGRLLVTTARLDGALVGYATFIVDSSLHYSTVLWGTCDVIWVAPEHRRSSLGGRLVEHSEMMLRLRGVTMIHVDVKIAHPALGELLQKCGYLPAATTYAKVLQRPE